MFLVIHSLIQKAKPLLKYIFLSIFSVIIIVLICLPVIDFQEYRSFNNLQAQQVLKVKIGNRIVAKKNFGKLFEELKYDEFTWVNHPRVIQKDTITIFTKKRKYLFLIKNTSNQGVLVSRINQNGSDYVTNRNDYLLQYIE
jgi:hypothetical protein